MPPFHISPVLLQTTQPRSQLAARIASALLGKSTTPFPVIPECPSPSCSCRETPSDLDIDYTTPISNNIAPYNSHILVSTGQTDWTSRIEDSPSASSQPWARLISDLKSAFGRKGRNFSTTSNTLVTASSLPPASPDARTILHFPSWREYSLPATPQDPNAKTPDAAAAASENSLLETLLSHLTTPEQLGAPMTTSLPHQIKWRDIRTPVILICTHNSRDSRCGILGPLLQAEFRDQLRALPPTITTANLAASLAKPENRLWRNNNSPDAHNNTDTNFDIDIPVAGISHIGGHKWAGNVVIYLPPEWATQPQADAVVVEGQAESPQSYAIDHSKPVAMGTTPALAGHAIWYGRVEPRHVEGILRETIIGGRVIRDLCRGVVDGNGRMVRI